MVLPIRLKKSITKLVTGILPKTKPNPCSRVTANIIILNNQANTSNEHGFNPVHTVKVQATSIGGAVLTGNNVTVKNEVGKWCNCHHRYQLFREVKYYNNGNPCEGYYTGKERPISGGGYIPHIGIEAISEAQESNHQICALGEYMNYAGTVPSPPIKCLQVIKYTLPSTVISYVESKHCQ